MATLYELTEDYLRLLEMAEDEDVDSEVLADTMEGIEGEIEDKADGYAKVMRQIDGDITSVGVEIARLTARKKSMENSKERIKKTLEMAMNASGKTSFKTELFNFKIQKNPPSLKLADDLDIALVPAEYLKFADPTIDKAKVKEALKQGEAIEWAHMEQTEGLRIK